MTTRAAIVVALLAWGALAFGAVYQWAYLPLFLVSATVGGTAVYASRHQQPLEKIVTISACAVGLAIAVQLVSIPVGWLDNLSPGADQVLHQYDLGYATGHGFHAMSLDPGLTTVALYAAVSVGLFVIGLARASSRADAIGIVRGVAALGVVLAFVGIAQRALWNGKIYGFWTPFETGGTAFGPFVNRNHFAGWMLMALPVTLGYISGLISRGMNNVKAGVRNRLIWFSSPEANETILLGFAVIAMSIAVVLTMSRSGMLGFVGGLVIIGWTILRNRMGRVRRIVLIVSLALVVGIAVSVGGMQQIAERFWAADSVGLDGRLSIWADSWRIFKDFLFVGTGVNAYRVAMPFYQTSMSLKQVTEAHNDYLQLLIEGGALVVLPAVAALCAIVSVARRRLRELGPSRLDYWIRAGAVAGLLAIAMQEVGDFSLQIPGDALMCATLLVLVLRRVDRSMRLGPVAIPHD